MYRNKKPFKYINFFCVNKQFVENSTFKNRKWIPLLRNPFSDIIILPHAGLDQGPLNMRSSIFSNSYMTG